MLSSRYILASSDLQLGSIYINMTASADRHRGRNLIDKGQIGVIMMFCMMLAITGPL